MRGRQPERKILELFLIVSRGGGGDEKIFPNMEKSAVKPRFSKQNICSVLWQKCWGAGAYQLRAHDARVCGRAASEKVTRNETRKCERKRTRKCVGTPEAVRPRPPALFPRLYEFFAFLSGCVKKGEHNAPRVVYLLSFAYGYSFVFEFQHAPLNHVDARVVLQRCPILPRVKQI